MLMRNLTTDEVYVFTYENWLSKAKGPQRTTVRELAAVVDDEEMVENTTYNIQVQTSDIAGECRRLISTEQTKLLFEFRVALRYLCVFLAEHRRRHRRQRVSDCVRGVRGYWDVASEDQHQQEQV